LQSKNLKDAKANAHIADDNLKSLELRSEIVARVAQTTRRHKAATIQPEQNGPRNWTMVLPYFRIDCTAFMPEAYDFSPSS
jgi:hypothetical protein